MSRTAKSGVTAPVVTITSMPLRDNRNYRIYSIAFDGVIVREQISVPGNVDVQWECDKRHLPCPAEFKGATPTPMGRKHVQALPYQLPQAQAGAVKPVTVRECGICYGSGFYSQDFLDGQCVSSPCGNCGGRGFVANNGGEA